MNLETTSVQNLNLLTPQTEMKFMTGRDVTIPVLGRLSQAYPTQLKRFTGGPVLIRVDDRNQDDRYPGFCDIHLRMPDAQSQEISLILDNVPFDDRVKRVAEVLDGTWRSTGTGEQFSLNPKLSNSTSIVILARAVR